jgi:hypothetical protein
MTPHETEEIDEKPTSGLDARARTALVGVAAFGAMLAAGAWAVFGGRMALSVAVGAAIAALNLYGLARILGGIVVARTEGDPGSGMWGIFAIVKVFALFGGVWLLMSAHLVDPLALVVGWGALPIGIAAGSLNSDASSRKSARSPSARAKEAPRE